jgi:hypothetical protein
MRKLLVLTIIVAALLGMLSPASGTSRSPASGNGVPCIPVGTFARVLNSSSLPVAMTVEERDIIKMECEWTVAWLVSGGVQGSVVSDVEAIWSRCVYGEDEPCYEDGLRAYKLGDGAFVVSDKLVSPLGSHELYLDGASVCMNGPCGWNRDLTWPTPPASAVTYRIVPRHVKHYWEPDPTPSPQPSPPTRQPEHGLQPTGSAAGEMSAV